MDAAYNVTSFVLVDNDPTLVQTMEEYLRRSNLLIAVAQTQAEAVENEKLKPDVIIANLDFMQENVTEFLRDLRNLGENPVIVIGSNRTESDIVLWLESGAHEYLNRPLSMRELLVRINSLVRLRFAQALKQRRKTRAGKWHFGGWELSLRTRQLRDPSGALVPLTRAEYALLIVFLEATQRPLSREYLQRATSIHAEILDRSVDVQILRLRRKLEVDERAPQLIRTVRGAGYVFTMPSRRVPSPPSP
ncbi:response regulator transcription factor [Sinorhizobium meliloti]|uniref:response regulator transcription factor n=1 Tax=Rhizobium meliloti TaxID=382 RepID=UPI000FE119A4|nr:response regulator transcription factor [Sinorhizobium meliloti]RVL88214.1 DNA-binding response regulator [Sinorhizobium meliloti]